MEDEIGLKVRLDKCHLYCPTDGKVQECKNLLRDAGFDYYGVDGSWSLLENGKLEGIPCTLE